jgi:hypothetical protein
MFWMKIGKKFNLAAKLLITMALAFAQNIMFWMKINKNLLDKLSLKWL